MISLLRLSIWFPALLLTGCYAHYLVPYWHQDPTRISGCVPIGHDTTMRQTEVTLEEYGEFIIAGHYDRSLYPADSALSDPTYKKFFEAIDGEKNMDDLREKIAGKLTDSAGNRVWYPGYYPIVGISFEQALRFCKWEETLVNSDRPDDKKVRVSLPSIGQYRTQIRNIDSIIHPRHPGPCKSPTFNYKVSFCLPKKWAMVMHGHDLMRVEAYQPTKLGLNGLYGLEGNAAEMTSTEGIAMGGSFRQYAGECSSDHQQTYSGPQDWVGFRYVVTLQAGNPRKDLRYKNGSSHFGNAPGK